MPSGCFLWEGRQRIESGVEEQRQSTEWIDTWAHSNNAEIYYTTMYGQTIVALGVDGGGVVVVVGGLDTTSRTTLVVVGVLCFRGYERHGVGAIRRGNHSVGWPC